ncbi:MAG: hypothetical protein ACOC3E_01710 [Cyanobacteriota bacterium]
MFTLFRKRYPQGSLISEFVTVDHGKYIVRALVVVDGITLATGLAAANTVEEAEDQARNRALALLELSWATETQTNETETMSPSISSKSLTSNQPSLYPKKLFPETDTSAIETSERINYSGGAIAEEDFSLPSQYPMPSSEPMTATSLGNNISEEESVVPENPLGTLNYDEMYVQTGVEIKRLGWTEEQGRTYLLENYGKRSRKQLGVEELAEFLQYLQTLPTPK